MDIQKAGISDLDALVELRIQYLTEEYGRLEKQEAETIAEKLPEYFRTHLGKDLFCYIVRDGKDVVSCAFLLVVEKRSDMIAPRTLSSSVTARPTMISFLRYGKAADVHSVSSLLTCAVLLRRKHFLSPTIVYLCLINIHYKKVFP